MSHHKLLFAACAFFCLASPQAFGSITYEITPRDGSIAPWSLDGGSITTDGTIGEISPVNFESWELRFSSPSGESTISSVNGGAFLYIVEFANPTVLDPIYPQTTLQQIAPSLTATADQLIANPGDNGFLKLLFATQDIFSNDFTGNAVVFFPRPESVIRLIGGDDGDGRGILIDNTVDNSGPFDPFDPFNTANSPNQSTFRYPPGPLVIGSVTFIPEPSTLLLATLAVVGMLVRRKW